MKKYLIVSVISVLSLGSFIVSCSKDDDDKKKCTCTESDGYKYSATREIDPASFNATSCADLELKLRMTENSGEFEYSCR